MSPKKKKPRLSQPKSINMKRENDSQELSRKRMKTIRNEEEELKHKKKENFIEACKLVSCNAYFDHRARLLLTYLPACMKNSLCKHHDKTGTSIKQMPPYAEESFKIEMKSNVWYEALEVCHMCITPVQYLSADVLQDVVEIMLNAHEDEFSEYSVQHIIDKCQQILSQNFSTHPPCLVKNLRICYKDFLTSPMAVKEKTFTNRTQYECNKGIVKYCMNRLEYEISVESQDGPLVDKYENIPEEMRESVKGLHWQKEKFEIFEMLSRSERIERLIAVLESVIELLQFDLAIWNSRYTNNLGRHIMRSHKPLMAFVLWSDNVLYTGAVTNNCRQILRIFAYIIHLQYPDTVLKVLTTWLNTMVQTFYICETNSNSDYPNSAKYSTVFANEFYKIILEMPHESIIKILERIEPPYMRHLLGVLHIKTDKNIISTNDDCIISILINFIKQSQWQLYPSDNRLIKIAPKLFYKPKKIKRILNFMIKKCMSWNPDSPDKRLYAKLDREALRIKSELTVNHVVQTLYITLEAYLDTFDIQSLQDTWNKLNEQMFDDNLQYQRLLMEHSSYAVTEQFIKKYRHIHKTLKELEIVFNNIRSSGEMPEILNIFKNIYSLHL